MARKNLGEVTNEVVEDGQGVTVDTPADGTIVTTSQVDNPSGGTGSDPEGIILTAPIHQNIRWGANWDHVSPLSPRDQALTDLVTSPEAGNLTIDDVTDRLKDHPAFAGDEGLLEPKKVALRLLHLRKDGLVHPPLARRSYERTMTVYRPRFEGVNSGANPVA